ncbi:MFS transporter [Novosphingobium sp. PP1Y]|uniref:MFS transporter n=1 Tax=Novosphingobium sp. PP1Y TaxID=702113 RepID=UPI00020EF8F9|nr:MFS transporter [Novosphingobium sp. PP1Y]CCA90777.1 major facilitator transporter [Novosphingobium sp. PP1Y]
MNASIASAPEPPSYWRALPGLVLLGVILAAGNCALGVFSAIQESAKAELQLTDTQLGLSQGLAMSLPLALLSIPVGLAVDRSHRVRLLLAVSLSWTLGTFLTAFANGFAMLFIARLLVGLGANLSTTIAISIAADKCLPDARGRALLLLTIGKYAGAALAFALGGMLLGFLETAHGYWVMPAWRMVHFVLGIGCLVMSGGVFLLREPVRLEIGFASRAPLKEVAREFWSYRRFLIPLFMGQVGVLMADAAAMIWAAPVLSRNYGLSPQDFAGWMGAVIFASGLLGASVGGFAADFGHRSNRRGGILLGAVLASALSLPAALFPVAPGATAFGVALFVLLLGGTVTGLITATAMAVLLPNDLRGLCVGSFLAFGGLIAFGAGPVMVTGLSAWLGGEAYLASALAAVGLMVSTFGALGFLLAMRAAPGPVR